MVRLMVQLMVRLMVQFSDQWSKRKKKKKNLLFFPSNFVFSNFEITKFEKTYKTCLYSNERIFSFETNFKRTTDEFWKNVIRSNDLSRKLLLLFFPLSFIFCFFQTINYFFTFTNYYTSCLNNIKIKIHFQEHLMVVQTMGESDLLHWE
jgi:hypothetical protein